MTRRPPRLAEQLLRWLLGPHVSTEFVVGDLREEFEERLGRGSLMRNWLWYCWQALRIALRVRIERRRERAALWVQEESRRGSGIAEEIMNIELRQALRFLLRRPAFSGVIALTVALAIAATTVAYAVVDGALLEPLPYPAPEQLVVVWEHNIPRNRDRNVASPANYLHWKESARSFSGVGAVVKSSSTLTGRGEPERIGAVVASASLFQVLGARALLGRLYTEAEDREGADQVVVLSEGYWLRRFGADRGIIGQSLTVNGTPRMVIGVLDRQFEFEPANAFSGTATTDIYVPPRYGEEARVFSGRFLQVVARLKPGVTIEQARAEMSAMAARAREEFPDRQAGWDVNVVPLRADIVGDARTMLLVIFGAVCFVLLIACANVANLLMTRATARQSEMAVRSALGAGRGRLIRQLLLECLLLAGVGGLAGSGLAQFALKALVASAPDIPRVEAIALDGSVMAFALLATVITALLFGVAPAFHMAGANAAGWLKERGSGGGRVGARRLRSTLVVVQVSLSLVLLIGAGLLIRSLANRLALGVGFATEQVLTADVSLSGERYREPAAQARFFEQLVERVRAIPGVSAASAITFAPLTGSGSATTFWALDKPLPEAGELPVADIRWVQRDYFKTLGIPVRAGRTFGDEDHENAPLHVVINETGARTLWPGQSAVGRRIAMPWDDTLRAEIVGVVGDVRHDGPDTELRTMLYWEHRQFRSFNNMTLVVRTAGTPTDIAGPLRAALGQLDNQLPLYNVNTMEQLLSAALARSRFATIALGLFAFLALVLAGIGIYGVISYATQQRAREIGIRMALGADRSSVVGLVVGQGAVLVGVALVIGALGASALSRLLKGLVFDVSTTDPLTFVAMALLLGLVGFAASWLPARRASSIDPVDAIRAE